MLTDRQIFNYYQLVTFKKLPSELVNLVGLYFAINVRKEEELRLDHLIAGCEIVRSTDGSKKRPFDIPIVNIANLINTSRTQKMQCRWASLYHLSLIEKERLSLINGPSYFTDLIALAQVDEDVTSILTHWVIAGANTEQRSPDTAKQRGETALIRACRQFRPGVANEDGIRTLIDTLLQHGADIDATCHNGGTALIYAAAWGRSKLIVTLIDKGANTQNINIGNIVKADVGNSPPYDNETLTQKMGQAMRTCQFIHTHQADHLVKKMLLTKSDDVKFNLAVTAIKGSGVPKEYIINAIPKTTEARWVFERAVADENNVWKHYIGTKPPLIQLFSAAPVPDASSIRMMREVLKDIPDSPNTTSSREKLTLF